MRSRRPLILTSAAAVAAASLLVAGCGDGSNSPTASALQTSVTHARTQFVAWAACMRSHGLAGYPDPVVSSSTNGMRITISPGSLNPNSPAFKAADRACHHVLPNGVVQNGTGGSSAEQQAQDVLFADCMRSHRVTSFPDPDHDGVFTLPATINEQAPAFIRAAHACQTVQPSSLSINQST